MAEPTTGADRTEARAAIVTGGASGIGLACVERLSAAGWRIGIVDRDPHALARLGERFADDLKVRIAALDVTDEPAAKGVLGDTAQEFGRLDGIVNSAGIGADMHVLETPVELLRRILDVNVVGTFVVGRAGARIMQATGGAIVNIASISGLRG